ncbi:MAG: hypothetical protein IJ560_04330 [Alphaproteobacteria bacterium]|nr:hypothetical protein [Alphaproteobacteria bacterium]
MKKTYIFIFGFVIGTITGFAIANVNWSRLITGSLQCQDGLPPDKNGCCSDEEYTDMGNLGFNCCPKSGGDCFPPIK